MFDEELLNDGELEEKDVADEIDEYLEGGDVIDESESDDDDFDPKEYR